MFIEIYILLDSQKREQIEFFIASYLEGFKAAAELFEVPQYSRVTEFSTEKIAEILEYLYNSKGLGYQLYWNNPQDGDIINGMVFFNEDGSLILGVSVRPEDEERYSLKLKEDFKSQYLMIYGVKLPPLSRKGFISEYREEM